MPMKLNFLDSKDNKLSCSIKPDGLKIITLLENSGIDTPETSVNFKIIQET